jgi:hypothetical protein
MLHGPEVVVDGLESPRVDSSDSPLALGDRFVIGCFFELRADRDPSLLFLCLQACTALVR